jgi:hypothetical protein
MPEMTIKMAMAMIDKLGITRDHKILYFGCAKGYLVKAMRLLWRQAWGWDISEYAIEHADSDVKQYCSLVQDILKRPPDQIFNWCIAKDVFEHVNESDISKYLDLLSHHTSKMFVIVPLGDGERFTVPAYNLDKTHCTAQTESWWFSKFLESGWKLKEFNYEVPGIKDNWAHHPKGNGFFILE